MTKEETIKIMTMLGAFYSGGKNDPKQQAIAWHLVLEKYSYDDAQRAVLRFAENDTRDYATFPAVGKIVAEIRAEANKRESLIREITTAVQYGKSYDQLSAGARSLIPEESYGKWMAVDPMEFAQKADKFADFLRNRQLQLEERSEA